MTTIKLVESNDPLDTCPDCGKRLMIKRVYRGHDESGRAVGVECGCGYRYGYRLDKKVLRGKR